LLVASNLLTDSGGIPLAISLTGGNRNEVTRLLPLIVGVASVAGKVGRPRQRPELVLADRGYDHDKYRRELRKRGINPVIARRGAEHGTGLGRRRWVVERTSRGCTTCGGGVVGKPPPGRRDRHAGMRGRPGQGPSVLDRGLQDRPALHRARMR